MTAPACRPVIALNAALRALVEERARAGFAARGLPLDSCHGDVIAVLLAEDGLSVSEIARRCGRAKSTVSVMIGRLERLGYLRKAAGRDDARQILISLTAAGRRLAPALADLAGETQRALRRSFTEAELAEFERLLRRAIAVLRRTGP